MQASHAFGLLLGGLGITWMPMRSSNSIVHSYRINIILHILKIVRRLIVNAKWVHNNYYDHSHDYELN